MLLICSILTTVSLFCDTFSFSGEGYSVDETKRGYLNFHLLNEDGNRYSLLDDGTYLNSRIFIKDGDKRFYLREHGKYAVIVDENSLTIKWRVETLDLIETYTKSDMGCDYSIEVKNRTEMDRNIGIYLMYDTYLGEKSGDHFLINNYKVIKREKGYSSFEIPQSIKSMNEVNQGIEFKLMDSDTHYPDQVILGNWEELAYSKKWPYKPNDGSLFSYGYYSINDSAIAIVYNGVNVAPEDHIRYSFSMVFLQNDESSDLLNQEDSVEESESKWTIEREGESSSDEINSKEEVSTEVVLEDDAADDIVEEEVKKVTGEELDYDKVLLEPVEVPSIIQDEEVATIESSDRSEDQYEDTGLTEKEELQLMLEYIQKKKSGEDVSEYGFDEEYIMEKLKNLDE